MHPLGSPFVRDQLSLRAVPLNPKRIQPDGEFVLYWLQSTQRLEENWALRFATLEADRLGRPLVVVQELGPEYEHASDRFHRFALEGARETARRAAELGIPYRFHLRRRCDGDSSALPPLVRRANLVVTDLFPTAGIAERAASAAEGAMCRVVAVDSVGVVPAAAFPREEYAARTIRPKIAKLRELSLEPVEDRPPRRTLQASAAASIEGDWLDVGALDDCGIDGEIARCDVDHGVGAAAARGGLSAARARLQAFVANGLRGYSERRRDPSDEEGSSRLSPWLHHGQLSAAEVARSVTRASSEGDVPADEAESFLNEMLTWRELSLNFCLRSPHYRALEALPDWARRSMARHAGDERDVVYSRDELEAAATHDALWNAGQRELVLTGQMHNVVRMLWGKSVITWSAEYREAHANLIWLNDKYAIDGRDPNSYAGIQWCFGKFDRPFATRPVWGSIRPMSLERAAKKSGMRAYATRWSG